jgi:hypothetical protein
MCSSPLICSGTARPGIARTWMRSRRSAGLGFGSSTSAVPVLATCMRSRKHFVAPTHTSRRLGNREMIDVTTRSTSGCNPIAQRVGMASADLGVQRLQSFSRRPPWRASQSMRGASEPTLGLTRRFAGGAALGSSTIEVFPTAFAEGGYSTGLQWRWVPLWRSTSTSLPARARGAVERDGEVHRSPVVRVPHPTARRHESAGRRRWSGYMKPIKC